MFTVRAVHGNPLLFRDKWQGVAAVPHAVPIPAAIVMLGADVRDPRSRRQKNKARAFCGWQP